MQLIHIPILLLMSAIALTLPTTTTLPTNTTLKFSDSVSPLPNLTKRSSYGWIAQFHDAVDGSCKDSQDPRSGRPKLYVNKCINLHFTNEVVNKRIGIDWGAGDYEIHNVTAWQTMDCKGELSKVVKRKGEEAGACFLLADLECKHGKDNPCAWGSVKGMA